MRSLRPRTIRARLLWIAFAITLFCSSVFTVRLYEEKKTALIMGINDVLENTALALPSMLPDDFHDSIYENPTSPPPDYISIVQDINDYAVKVGVEYMCTVVKFDDEYFMTFLAGSRCANEPADFSHFMFSLGDISTSANWSDKGVIFTTYENEYGTYRSAVYPVKTQEGRTYYSSAEVSLSTIHQSLETSLYKNIALGTGIFIAIWLITYSLITLILAPIGKLSFCTSRIFNLAEQQRHDLTKMAEHYHDEVGSLAHAFMEMENRLQKHVEELTRMSTAEERRKTEMRIANCIQTDFLPKDFPHTKDVSLFADMRSAQDVGGDLYSFRIIDEHHLFFCVGDVSGKGIAAALLMAKAKVLFEHMASHIRSAGQILERINTELSQRNTNLMFTTAFCGVLDLKTGQLCYSNAGHNPPLLLERGRSPRKLHLPSGLVMGIRSQEKYTEETVTLAPGSIIAAYTDGVPEAANTNGELFTETKLINLCANVKRPEPRSLVAEIFRNIDIFADGAAQTDDITVIGVQFRPDA